MTTTVTKESLAARIAELESGARSLKEDYTLAAYKMLLTTMKAEPVAWEYEWASYITCGGPQDFERIIELEAPPEWAIEKGLARNIIPLYRHAQPAPVVPDKMTAIVKDEAEYVEGWNDCRATMLNQVGNSPAQNQGWIPVSEQMPENKPGCYEYLVFETLNNRVNHDYWNVPDKGEFTPFWNHYGEYVTHWMPLPADPVK